MNDVINKVFELFDNKVYLVGGSVRDILMKKQPKDYDFATPLLPDEIEKIIKKANKKAYNIGKRFGTLGIKIDGNLIEITTFRIEKYKPKNRKPIIEFANNIHQDLSRRDFTINAMAYRKGKFYDFFNGKQHIKDKKLHFVGNAKTRIKEDPLRMLRFARFASSLNFDMELNAMQIMYKNAYKILHISKERWGMELDKILLSDNPAKGLNCLMDCRLFNFMIPELSLQKNYNQNNPYHKFDLWNHTLNVVKKVPKDINMKWAALLHDIAKPFVRINKEEKSIYVHHDYLGSEIIEKTARYLKWSNERRKRIKEIVLNHMSKDSELKIYDDDSKT